MSVRVNKTTGQMYLYGIIGSEDFGGKVSDVDIVDALQEIGDKRAIVHINSIGGMVDIGIGIYNLLKAHKPGVEIVNDGICASIATVIAMAGDVRKTTVGSRWMIHRVRGGVFGTAEQMEKKAAEARVYDEATTAIYKEALRIDDDKLGQMLDTETWFSADQALELGLATEKIGQKAVLKTKLAAWIENPPTDVLAACADEEPVVKVASVSNPQAIKAKSLLLASK